MSGMGPNLAIQTPVMKYQGVVAKDLGLNQYNPKEAEKIADYIRAYEASLTDPLYLNAAERLGIKNYNSIDDYKKVLANLSGTGGAAPAASNNSSNGNKLPYPNDGTYNNIIGNTNYEGNLGQEAAKAYDRKQPDNPGGDPIQVDSIVTAADAALAGGATATTEATTAAPTAADQQAAAIKAASDAQAKALNDLMIKQDNAYQQQLALQQQQIDASNAALAEQRRQSDALSRAYIPTPLQSAAAPVMNGFNSAGKNPNTLSSLSILGGKSYGSSSLTGLQIA
jgi:hypothetical protein